jgi:uncharacterized membrane protein
LALRKFHSPNDFQILYHNNPTLFYLSGRLESVVLSVAAVFLVILIAQRLFNRPIGLTAGFLLALNPLFVHFSKLVRTDVQMTFWVLLAFWFCLNIIDNHRQESTGTRSRFSNNLPKNYLTAGFLSGVAIATKYPAALIVIVIILAYFLNNGFKPRSLYKLVASGLACLAGLFISAPFLFLDFQKALADFRIEDRTENLSANGGGIINNLVWYIHIPLVRSMTWVGLILAGLGIILVLRKRNQGAWLAAAFVCVFLFFTSSLKLRWDRWIIPILPFLCMFTGMVIYDGYRWLKEREYSFLAVGAPLILLLCVAVPLTRADLIDGGGLSGKPVEIEASEWMTSHIPVGSKVLEEVYTGIFPKNQFSFYSINKNGEMIHFKLDDTNNEFFYPSGSIGEISDVNLIRTENIQYVVLSNMYSRYKAEQDKYPQDVARYEEIMAMGHLVFWVDAIPGKNDGPVFQISGENGGTVIRIYQIP